MCFKEAIKALLVVVRWAVEPLLNRWTRRVHGKMDLFILSHIIISDIGYSDESIKYASFYSPDCG